MKFFLPLFFLFCISLPSCGQSVATNDVQAAVISAPVDTAPKKTRNFTRFEREILQFEAADIKSRPAQQGILFVGSSSIRLWKSIQEDMGSMPVTNRGFGGATIAEVNYYFQRIVAKYQPRFLVFYAGENDLFHPEISVDSVINDFNRFRDSMRMYGPTCRMYFISVKPSPARWPYQAKFTEANDRFRTICEADPTWTYVDVVPRMLDDRGRPRKEIYRSDSLHMNAYGYKDWTEILRPVLLQAWKTSTQIVDKAR